MSSEVKPARQLNEKRLKRIAAIAFALLLSLLIGGIFLTRSSSSGWGEVAKDLGYSHSYSDSTGKTEASSPSPSSSSFSNVDIDVFGVDAKANTNDYNLPSLEECTHIVKELASMTPNDNPTSSLTSTSGIISNDDISTQVMDTAANTNTTTITNTAPMVLKPLWLNMYPSTMLKSSFDQFFTLLTNRPDGAKSYYAIQGRMRKCLGGSQTVACENVHPTVGMAEPDGPAKFNNFFGKYILTLRNPLHVMPASVYVKGQKYHNLKGPLPEESWIGTRDAWVEKMWDEWKSTITAWHDTKYEAGMYLAYEDIFDSKKGPKTLMKLALLLQDAGFEIFALGEDNTTITTTAVTSTPEPEPEPEPGLEKSKSYSKEERIHCLWSHLVMPKGGIHDFEDWGYTPSYTEDHKVMLRKGLDQLMDDVRDQELNNTWAGGSDLIEILKRYRRDLD